MTDAFPQPDLFSSLEQARSERDTGIPEALKREGMRRADDNASQEWKVKADAAIARLAAERPWFTSDDVQDTGVEQPERHQAWGMRYQQAARRGLIYHKEERLPSRRPTAHCATVRKWYSVALCPPESSAA